MKNDIFSILILLASITYQNCANAQYCTPLYGFQLNSSTEEVVSVQVDAENGSVSFLSNLEGSNGITTAALNINDKLIHYVESSIPRFITNNSVTGEPLSPSGIFNVTGLKELEYNCDDKILYGFRESINGFDLVSVDWQAEQISNIYRFNSPSSQISSSAINAKEGLIFVLIGNNVLHTYNIASGVASNQTLNENIIEIEYDVNDNIIYAYTENGAFGSIENGTFTQIGNIIPLQGEPISTAFDPFTNTFFIANNTKLLSIDTQTGNIINEFTLSEPLYRLNTGVPCEIEADFSFDNTCIGLPIQFTDASIGASNWLWDFGDGVGTSTEKNPIYTYNTAGMYEVQLRASGCDLGVDDTTMLITVTEQPIFDLGEDVMACGSSYRINPGIFDPSFVLNWNFGVINSTFNVTNSDTYYLTVENGTCFSEDSINVTLLDTPEVDLGTDKNFCDAINVELDAQNPMLDVVWSTGETSPKITVNNSGIYWVDVSNENCTTRDSVSIDLFEALDLDLGNDTTICANSYVLDAGISGPGITYLWSNGAGTQTTRIAASGTYEVLVSSGNCRASAEITINFSNNISTSLGEDILACAGDRIILDAGANADSYLWSEGSITQTLEVSESGEYIVEIANGECISNASIKITFNEAPVILLPADIVACSDTSIVLTAPETPETPIGNNYEYEWSTGETTQSILANATGNYSVRVNNLGCDASDDIRITINAIPEVDLGDDQTICLEENEVAILNAGENFEQYSWSTGEQSVSIEVARAGNYSVTVEDSKGCTNSDEIMVLEQCEAKIFMPTAFSPNGDTQNDLLKPTVKFIENYALKIFNRYGQVVFSTTDTNAAWDGIYNSIKQPIGVFSWIVEYTTQEGEKQKRKGNVTLIR